MWKRTRAIDWIQPMINMYKGKKEVEAQFKEQLGRYVVLQSRGLIVVGSMVRKKVS
jgi:hypothetical protein